MNVKAFAQTSVIYLPANLCFTEASVAILKYYCSYNHKTCSKCTNLFSLSSFSRIKGILHSAYFFILSQLVEFASQPCRVLPRFGTTRSRDKSSRERNCFLCRTATA